jgi:predicted nucleic acid-binding protein
VATRSYLDASAIVKLARREPGSDVLENTIINREALFSSSLGAAEAFRAVRRFDTKAAVQIVQEIF